MGSEERSVRTLRGVGERRAQALERLGIHTIENLLLHYPRNYIDLSKPCEISSAPFDEPCTVRAVVVKKGSEIRAASGIRMYKAVVEDESGSLELTFFNNKFALDAL